MKTIDVENGPKGLPTIVQGCMRMPALTVDEAARVIRNAYDLGVTFFDHATCYGKNGEAETRFGDAFLKTGIRREDVFLQSKCAIYPERSVFDWSRESVLKAVDEILTRLRTDYLDALLLHRPDLLFDPEEVAQTFDILYASGKVRHFGVSNLAPMQIELLKKYLNRPLVFNQLQFSLEQSQLVDQALYVNNKTTEMSVSRDCGLLDYCRLHGITIQAWSPLQYGFFQGVFIDAPQFPQLNGALEMVGRKYGLSKTATAIAWILRHPAKMQVVVGTMTPERLKDICTACNVVLEREDWYELYLASGKFLP